MAPKIATPRGIRNNNPCNIKFNSRNNWHGQLKPKGEFCTFSDPLYGLRAAYKIIGTYYNNGFRTIYDIISRWAPDGSVIVKNYAYYVARGCGMLSSEEINPRDADMMIKFMKGIVKFENGINPYECKLYKTAYVSSDIARTCKLQDTAG